MGQLKREEIMEEEELTEEKEMIKGEEVDQNKNFSTTAGSNDK